jgi:hypothetical protein
MLTKLLLLRYAAYWTCTFWSLAALTRLAFLGLMSRTAIQHMRKLAGQWEDLHRNLDDASGVCDTYNPASSCQSASARSRRSSPCHRSSSCRLAPSFQLEKLCKLLCADAANSSSSAHNNRNSHLHTTRLTPATTQNSSLSNEIFSFSTLPAASDYIRRCSGVVGTPQPTYVGLPRQLCAKVADTHMGTILFRLFRNHTADGATHHFL